MFVVVYAKITDDRDDGIRLAGVHFGGLGANKTEAEKIARDCVNTIKGGTIMPRLYESNGKCDIIPIMEQAEEAFRKKEEDMRMAAKIMARKSSR